MEDIQQETRSSLVRSASASSLLVDELPEDDELEEIRGELILDPPPRSAVGRTAQHQTWARQQPMVFNFGSIGSIFQDGSVANNTAVGSSPGLKEHITKVGEDIKQTVKCCSTKPMVFNAPVSIGSIFQDGSVANNTYNTAVESSPNLKEHITKVGEEQKKHVTEEMNRGISAIESAVERAIESAVERVPDAAATQLQTVARLADGRVLIAVTPEQLQRLEEILAQVEAPSDNSNGSTATGDIANLANAFSNVTTGDGEVED